MNNFFDKLVGNGDKAKKKPDTSKQSIKNPFAQIGAALQGNGKKFEGRGESLGGSKPGKVISVELKHPGPLGVKVEKRPNSLGTAIVAMVVPGSQADVAGLQRGDIICFAGSNGQEEMMYDMFIELAGSNHRPLEFDIRRIETKVSGDSGLNTSAEAYSRKQAVIAAAEAREKAAKKLEKPMVKRAPVAKKEEVDLNADLPDLPQSEEAYLAVQAAKQNESALAAKLGYNPYETNKSTAGQARSATVTTKYGDMATNTSGAPGSVPPPSAGTTVADDEGSIPSAAFQQAFEECVISNDAATTLSSFGVMRKLILNATTKGQMEGEESSKFRRVRLSNPKISTAIIEVHGALDLMLAVGFMLVEDDGESYLIYPPQDKGPSWLPSGLKQMQRYEGQK